MQEFKTPFAWLISGYRNARRTSRHSHGRAADVVLPGVSDRKLAAYFRRQGFVGVGLYPVSGFVHIDVRAQSHFWVDYSSPGAPSRTRAILKTLAKKMDRRAAKNGILPVTPLADDVEKTPVAEPAQAASVDSDYKNKRAK